ncbi:hypothetical protein AAG570_010361 [Ranatra chinensis]|uniref:Uncharacterized protein n=1 Tax=Ranatra chinensis TaxID=642074 RepID=A0ABD0YMB0_9HEMI
MSHQYFQERLNALEPPIDGTLFQNVITFLGMGNFQWMRMAVTNIAVGVDKVELCTYVPLALPGFARFGHIDERCIKRNLPRSALNEVEDDNWKCYCCNVKPLYALRANCWAAQEYAAVVKKKPSENSRKRKLEASSGGEDSSKEEKIKKNKSMKIEEEPHAKQTKKHIKAAAAKLSDFLGDTVTMIELVKKKGIEYKNKKATTRTLKNVDSVVDFAKKVDTMLENIEKSSMKMRENLNNFIESWKKSVEETSISSSENVEEIEAEEGRLEEKNKDIDIEGELKEVDKNGRGDEDDQKANSDREREVEEGNKEESEINSDTERTEEENVKGDRDESSVEIGVKKIAPPTDSTDEGPERSLVFDEAVTPVAGLNDNREESTGREKHERMETDKA